LVVQLPLSNLFDVSDLYKANGKTYDTESIMNTRCVPYSEACQNEEDIAAVTWFVLEALPAVNNNWNKDLTRQNEFMTKVVTRTDEAFVLWTIQTSKDRWLQHAESDGKDKVAEDDLEDDDEKGARRFGSDAGMELYENLVQKVEKTRELSCCEDWDRQIQGQIRDRFNKGTKRIDKPTRSKKRKYQKNFDMLVDI